MVAHRMHREAHGEATGCAKRSAEPRHRAEPRPDAAGAPQALRAVPRGRRTDRSIQIRIDRSAAQEPVPANRGRHHPLTSIGSASIVKAEMVLLSILGRHRSIGVRSHMTAGRGARDDRRDVVFFAANVEMNGATQTCRRRLSLSLPPCPEPNSGKLARAHARGPFLLSRPQIACVLGICWGARASALAVLGLCAHHGGDRPMRWSRRGKAWHGLPRHGEARPPRPGRC
jgi:hypothetical protein